MEEFPSRTSSSSSSSFCSLVSKGNTAYAMSDARPSRPLELLEPPAAPSGDDAAETGVPGAGSGHDPVGSAVGQQVNQPRANER